MALRWRRYLTGKFYREGERGDEVPGDAQGCAEGVGRVADDWGEAAPPELLAGGNRGGSDLTGRTFQGVWAWGRRVEA